MYFIASTFEHVFSQAIDKDDWNYKEVLSPDDKLHFVYRRLLHTYELIKKITKLIIINPSKEDITQSDIARFSKNNELSTRNPIVYKLLESCIILNSGELKIPEENVSIYKRAQSLNVSIVKKIIRDKMTLFMSNSLDLYSIKILRELSKREGYRRAYNLDFSYPKISYPIQDVDDYLEFRESCLSEYSSYHYSNKNLYSLFDDTYFVTKKGVNIGDIVRGFITGKSSKLLIQADDEFLIKGISVEIQNEIGKLYEYDCIEGNYAIKQNETGLIFYNCRSLSNEKLYSLCTELRRGEYKDKPVLLLTRERINQLVDLGFESIALPSFVNNNYNKMKLLLTLLLKNNKSVDSIQMNSSFHDALDHLKTGGEIDYFISEQELDVSTIGEVDHWYELKSSANIEVCYKFEHIATAKGHRWKVTGNSLEEPLDFKYYPNKCLMYLTYLAKYPQKIDIENLYEAVDKWAIHVSKHLLSKGRIKNKLKKKISLNGKTPQERACNSISGTFTDFFGLQKRQENKKKDPEAEKIKFLYTEDYIVIGPECFFNSKGKIHIEVEDTVLDSL